MHILIKYILSNRFSVEQTCLEHHVAPSNPYSKNNIKNNFMFQIFFNKSCEYFSFLNKKESLFCLRFVLFLFSLIKVNLNVDLFSIVYDALLIKTHLRILTRKRDPKIKLQRLRKIRIWTFGSLIHQINSF